MSRPGSLALLMVVACGGGAAKPPPDPATVRGPGMAGVLACQAVVRAIDATVACGRTPDERKLAELSMKKMREMHTSTEPVTPDALPMFAAGCVSTLDSMIDGLRWQQCAYTPTTDERAWVAAQRKQRTGLPRGALDRGSREALQQLMDVRDDVCRCKDPACVQAAQQRLNAELKPLPPDATVETRDTAGRILDEAMRCGRRIEHAQVYVEPYQSPSPDEVQRMLEVIQEVAPPLVMDDGEVEDHEEPEPEEEEDEQPGSDVVVPFR